jgi:hypothetical protein
MGRLIAILFVVVGLVSAMAVLYQYNQTDSVLLLPPQTASVGAVVVSDASEFSETGTLVFYPNNVGPVPYLFYQDQNGRTVAKALTFPDSPPGNFSSWTGAHISVMGQIVAEHVVVSTIAYLSGP